MSKYDVLVAELRCPKCGVVTEARLQTQAQPVPAQRELRPGDPFIIEHASLLEAGFLCVRRPERPRVSILQQWNCKSCSTTKAWAMITVAGGKLEKIEVVPAADRATIERAYYVEDFVLRELDEADDDLRALLLRGA